MCARILDRLNRTEYYPELNGKLIDSGAYLKVYCVICCLSRNYEQDSKRQSELSYAFKTQHRLIPIRIEHDFIPQEPDLKHILVSVSTSAIDFSEHTCAFSEACQQLYFGLDKFETNENELVINALNYSNIYQECERQGWDEIPKLLFPVSANLLHDAIDKRQSDDITKLINLMFTLSNHYEAKVRLQVDRFQQWLANATQENKNTRSEHPIEQPQLCQKVREHHDPVRLDESVGRSSSQLKITEQTRTVIRNLHDACEHNDIQQVRDILKSITIDQLNAHEKSEQSTALHIASQSAHYEIVQLLLQHGGSMMKRNRYGLTPFSQAKDERTKRIFAQYQRPPPRFTGDVLEWTVTHREPAIKRAQIRNYLARQHFIDDSFEKISRRYVRCYLPLEGFSDLGITQLESIGYTSVEGFIRAYTSSTRFYEYINHHLAKYALPYFAVSIDTSTPYSFIHCLLSIVASILHSIRYQTSFTGNVYRGMLITQEYLDKYIVDSRILNTAFLSTSKDRTVAEIFAGIDKDQTLLLQDSTKVKVLCRYKIRNRKTAYYIERLSNMEGESEVLVFPFSAFHVTGIRKTSSGIVEVDLDECDEEQWPEDDEMA